MKNNWDEVEGWQLWSWHSERPQKVPFLKHVCSVCSCGAVASSFFLPFLLLFFFPPNLTPSLSQLEKKTIRFLQFQRFDCLMVTWNHHLECMTNNCEFFPHYTSSTLHRRKVITNNSVRRKNMSHEQHALPSEYHWIFFNYLIVDSLIWALLTISKKQVLKSQREFVKAYFSNWYVKFFFFYCPRDMSISWWNKYFQFCFCKSIEDNKYLTKNVSWYNRHVPFSCLVHSILDQHSQANKFDTDYSQYSAFSQFPMYRLQ